MKYKDADRVAGRPNRRILLGGLATSALLAIAGVPLTVEPGRAQSGTAQQIANHFASVKTMTGEFVQFGPRGEQTTGQFHIARPGRMRFNYADPSPMQVIADGRSVVIGNERLGTWDIYPLSQTPLKLLLSERIDLSGDMVKSVQESAELITITLGDKSVFGDSTITMMFDPQTFELKQWTMVDAQGKETTVMITKAQTGVQFASNVFDVPYDRIRNRSMR